MKKILFYTSSLLLLLVATVACNDDKDLYQPPTTGGETEEANTFNFSTVNNVNLNVNYNLEGTKFAVAFEVYAENPVNEVKDDEGNVVSYVMKDGVMPIYGDYTKGDGTFSKKVELPAYAETLYILTPNPLVGPTLMTATVSGNNVTASAPANKAVKAKVTRAKGVQTDVLFPNLWSEGDTKPIYPEWKSWLGTFDSETGRPSYLLDRNASENEKLVFTDKELKGLYETISEAVNINKECPKEYRQEADLELTRKSEIAITMLGGNTCWNNTLGYFYYTGNAPTSLKDVHVICIYPNTQDGKWTKGTAVPVGLERGDVVKLIYYPNIAQGSKEGATSEFPAGIKIGFVLKNNGWYKGSRYQGRPNNFWAASTEGLTNNGGRNQNGLGTQTRTAKFQYTSDKDSYAIVSFEDYQNDKNFSDVAFSLKPASAFKPLPEIVAKEMETSGVYAFEDLWPDKGDYDMNDVVVNYTYAKTMQKYEDESDDYFKIMNESMTFKTFQNYATKNNGLAFKLLNAKGFQSSAMEMKLPTEENFKTVQFVTEVDGDGNTIYILTNNVKTNMGAEYRLSLTYGEDGKDVASTTSGQAQVQPFIYKAEEGGRWEVHIPFEAPSSKVIKTYFHTGDDLSEPDKKIYYVRAGNYPFAFYLAGATEKDVEPLLNKDNESKAIDVLYPKFINWATSNGANDKDWYKHSNK